MRTLSLKLTILRNGEPIKSRNFLKHFLSNSGLQPKILFSSLLVYIRIYNPSMKLSQFGNITNFPHQSFQRNIRYTFDSTLVNITVHYKIRTELFISSVLFPPSCNQIFVLRTFFCVCARLNDNKQSMLAKLTDMFNGCYTSEAQQCNQGAVCFCYMFMDSCCCYIIIGFIKQNVTKCVKTRITSSLDTATMQ